MSALCQWRTIDAMRRAGSRRHCQVGRASAVPQKRLWSRRRLFNLTSAFARHSLAAVGLDLDAQRLGQEAVGVIVPDRIGDLDDFLRREEFLQSRKGRIVNIAAMRHLFDISERGALLVVE